MDQNFTINACENSGTVFPITIGNDSYHALFDTGADLSCMSFDVYTSLNLPPLSNKFIPRLRTANGGDMKPLGRINVKFSINGSQFNQSFIVCGAMTRSFILGRDFSITYCMGIRWTKNGTKVLTYHNDVIFETKEREVFQPYHLIEKVCIPPGSGAVVKLGSNYPTKEKQIFELNELLVQDNPNMTAFPHMIDPNDSQPDFIPFNIKNYSPTRNLYLPAGTVVAFGIPETSSVDYIAQEKSDDPLPRHWIPKRPSSCELLPSSPENSDFISSPALVQGNSSTKLEDSPITNTTKVGLDNLFAKFSSIFSKGSDDIGHTNLIKMPINTGNSRPLAQRPYPLALQHHEWLEKELEILERAGVIEKSVSPWANPIVVVKKKSAPGEPIRRRLCIDFRKLNALLPEVKKAASAAKGIVSLYPLPRIDDMYAKLRGAKVFSTLDLRAGYHHIGLTKDSIEKTAFVTPFGKYQFNKLPFGLAQAPAYFQLLMDHVLQGLSFAFAYLDDIIIFSTSESEHLEHVKIVFQRLREFGLKLKKEKCNFFKKHIQYLGHLISAAGIQPLPDKLDSIKNMPTPKNSKEIKQFLGLIGYYRKFIPRFSDLARPMTRLTRKDEKFLWSNECQHTFELMKSLLSHHPILRYPDPNKPYVLFTDASNYAWAGVLTQEFATEINNEHIIQLHPVAYVSGLFNPSQQKWAALVKEAHAIYMAARKLNIYLEGADTTIKSDHLPLRNFLLQNTKNKMVNNWSMELEHYNFKMEHISGAKNILADTLSRLIEINSEVAQTPEPIDQCFGVATFEDTPTINVNELQQCYTGYNISETKDSINTTIPLDVKAIRKFQKIDQDIQKAFKDYVNGTPTSITIIDGLVHKILDSKPLLWIPKQLQDPLLIIAHDHTGHNGFRRCYNALKAKFFWKNMKEQVRYHTSHCHKCNTYKNNKDKVPPGLFVPPKIPMDSIAMDLIEINPPTRNGNKYALTVVDMFTSYVFCIPIPSKSAADVVNAYLNNIYCIFGGSRVILSDNGSEFKNKLFDTVAKELGMTRHAYSAVYAPFQNGKIEALNRFLKCTLGKIICENLPWDEAVPLAVSAYNFFPNQAAQESPYFLMFGRDPTTNLTELLAEKPRYMADENGYLNLEVLSRIYATVAKRILHNRQNKLKPFNKPPPELKPNQLVYVKNHTASNLEPKFKENYRILSTKGTTHVEVRSPQGHVSVMHRNDIKPMTPRDHILQKIPQIKTFGRQAKCRINYNKLPDLTWMDD